MLVDIFLLESFNGVSANQYTQVSEEIAEMLVSKGIAKKDSVKTSKVEVKSKGK